MRARRVTVLSILCLLVLSAPASAAGTKVTVPLPSPGDASYGVVQVTTKKGGKLKKSKKGRIYKGTLAGLKLDARTPKWKQLRKDTKVYVVASPVKNAAKARNVAVFITRPKGGKGPASGKVTLNIANAKPDVASYWVKSAKKNGSATIFSVRNIISTAVGNWARYLQALKAARALKATHVDLNGRFARTPRQSSSGTLALGGSKMSATARRLYELLFGTIGDPLLYQRAKQSAIVPLFIATDLKNPELATQWALVARDLPLQVPDQYAAAAAQEAQFTRVAKPRITRAAVYLAENRNSTTTAAAEMNSDPLGVPYGKQLIRIEMAGNARGVVSDKDIAIGCSEGCDRVTPPFTTVRLTFGPTEDVNRAESVTGCDSIERYGPRIVCTIEVDEPGPTRTVRATIVTGSTPTATPTPTATATATATAAPSTAATSLDTAFGTGGFTTSPFTVSAFANAVVAQPDGKLVVVGATVQPGNTFDWYVERFTATGAIDTSFSGDGRVEIDNNGMQNGAMKAAITPDGSRIYVVGSRNQANPAVEADFDVRALTSAGDPVPGAAFGLNGIALNEITGATQTFGQDIALQADGKVLVAGSATFAGGGTRPFVARLNTNGTEDTTFNSGSAVWRGSDAACDSQSVCEATGMSILTNGNTTLKAIYLGGYRSGTSYQGHVMKLVPTTGETDVALDTSYDGDGVAVVDSARVAIARDLFVYPSGEAVLAGQASDLPRNQCGLAGLKADGSTLTSFGTGGSTKISLSGGCGINAIAYQLSNGRLVFAGERLDFGQPYLPVIGAVTNAGQPDTDYVAGGATFVTTTGSEAFYNGLLLQNAQPVVVGAKDPFPHDPLIARFNGK